MGAARAALEAGGKAARAAASGLAVWVVREAEGGEGEWELAEEMGLAAAGEAAVWEKAGGWDAAEAAEAEGSDVAASSEVEQLSLLDVSPLRHS